jgi:hypothetical protein
MANSRRPKDTELYQQNLHAWQPIYTPASAAFILVIAGVIFLFIGVGVLTASRKIWNFETDYTHCVAQSVLVNKVE